MAGIQQGQSRCNHLSVLIYIYIYSVQEFAGFGGDVKFVKGTAEIQQVVPLAPLGLVCTECIGFFKSIFCLYNIIIQYVYVGV